MDNLRNALPYMPHLEVLDVSDNPIEDNGVRSVGLPVTKYVLNMISMYSHIINVSIGV